MPFLSDKKNWRAPRSPPTLIFFPKSTNQNFKTAILFSLVENHNNYVFGMTYSPKVPGGGAASYKIWPVFKYSNGYWEVYGRFSGWLFWFGGGGWGEGAMWEDLSLEECVMKE